jgi:hypothetical protein
MDMIMLRFKVELDKVSFALLQLTKDSNVC